MKSSLDITATTVPNNSYIKYMMPIMTKITATIINILANVSNAFSPYPILAPITNDNPIEIIIDMKPTALLS